ncbi:MAG TPA: hypothetical protein VFS20_24175, partial [Longimicrobium sp.]|nr:hypothetical protein [Longimicrobium sp.]
MRSAAAAAAEYLLARCAPPGTWSDFLLLPGTSDEWVTAYVALALAEHGGERGLRAARSAWSAMEGRQRPDGRWGY